MFQYILNMQGQNDPNIIKYTDENGQVWFVPRGHRIWSDIYQPWLDEGNKPDPAVPIASQ